MCDYRIESYRALIALPVPLTKVRGYLGPVAHNRLMRVIRDGGAQPGRDLSDGKPLPPANLARAYYMSDGNFQLMLARMCAEPQRCQWCGGTLPPSLVRQHYQAHNHREEIRHHFHEPCWRARLLAVAVIFGHVQPEQLLARQVSRSRMLALRKTVTWTVQKVFTVITRSRSHSQRRWHR